METAAQKLRIVTMAEWTAVGLMFECPEYECSGICMPAGRGGGICYWTAVMLMPGEAIPAGLSIIAIPAKRYACWHFHDEPGKLPREMGDIFGIRLLASGLHQDPDWIAIEHYPPD